MDDAAESPSLAEDSTAVDEEVEEPCWRFPHMRKAIADAPWWMALILQGMVTAVLMFAWLLGISFPCPYHDNGWWPAISMAILAAIPVGSVVLFVYRVLRQRLADGSFAPFQFHLSTLVVVVLLAGTMIGMNVAWKRTVQVDGDWAVTEYTMQGWPCSARVSERYTEQYLRQQEQLGDDDQYWYMTNACRTEWSANAVICLGILAVFAIVCEWWIRRRVAQARGPAPSQASAPLPEMPPRSNHFSPS
ncbi:MAG: hypothetical protein NTW87_26375 [Planctomycetota bacterium]|nr:hypothetical protein [Planctomycetota bacterium]